MVRSSPTIRALALSVALLAPPSLMASPLAITEIHYNPAGQANNEEEWIEIYNQGPDPLDLSGYTVCRGVNFTFPPGTWLAGRQYLVLCANESHVRSTYGITNTVGNWSGSALSNAGENVALCDPAGVEMTRVNYNDRGNWPGGADGTGYTLSILDPYLEQDDADSWGVSRDVGGSPGRSNPLPASVSVVINEAHLLPTSGEPWVEIYNDGDSPVDLGGYRLTAQRDLQGGYTIPGGTSIAARGFVSFNESELGFDLLLDAEPPLGRLFLALVQPAGGRLADARIFEPDRAGSSEARIPDGDEDWSEAALPTRDSPNATDADTNVVINEIMYHSLREDPRREYVELFNRSTTTTVDLSGWSFTDGISFTFPSGASLAPGAYLVVARDPEWLRDTYGLPASQVYGPEQDEASLDAFGQLRNQGERLTLSDDSGNQVDTCRFHDGGDWSRWADGRGSSLELIDATANNNRGSAWDASDDSAKAETRTYTYTGRHAGGESELHFLLLGRGITLVDDVELTSTAGGGNLVPNGTFDANDSSWMIEGNHVRSGRTEVDPITGAGSLKIVSTGRGDNKVNRIETATSNLSTSVTYRVTFKARWVVGAQTLLTRGYTNNERHGLARSHDLDVPDDLGTPGMENSVTSRQVARTGAANLGPVISKVEQDPIVPGNNESVTVSARVEDPDGVAAVNLHYILNSPEGGSKPVEPTPIGVFDDHRDVGNPCGAGSTTHLGGTRYRVVGGGDDIWTGGDQFHFAFIEAAGNFDMRARLESKDWANGSRWGKGGIMARQDLSNRSRYSMIQDHGEDLQDAARFANRLDHGGSNNTEEGQGTGAAHPAWVRLTRVGDTFRGYTSTNGSTWTQVGPSKNWGSTAPDVVLLGLALTSHAGCATSTITFADVEIIGGDDPVDPPDPGGGDCDGASCTVAMTDPDGDGLYTATIPGQALREKIVYHIEAADASGATSRYPEDVPRRTHPLVLDPENPPATDLAYLVYRHDTRNPATSYLNYRFWLHDANEAVLGTRRLHSNDQLSGSFVFGSTQMYYSSSLRFAGSPWARGGFGGSYRVTLPRDEPLFGAVSRFNMENHATDSKEQISHYLIRHNNVGGEKAPYSLQWMTRFQLNDSFSGNREHIEAPNTRFLNLWWKDDDDGSFFEIDDRHEMNDGGGRQSSVDAFLRYPPYSSLGSGADKEAYRWFFGLRADEAEDDYSHLIDFAQLLDPSRTSSSVFDQRIWDECNVESFLRVWAIRNNTSDWDQWGTDRGKNAYIYRPAIEGRWYLIPWDMELTYDNAGRFPLPSSPGGSFNYKFPEVNRFLSRPRIKRMYYGILKTMVDTTFRSSFLSAFRTRLDAIGRGSTGIMAPGQYIDQRRNHILSRIGSVTYPSQQLEITTNSGNDFVVDTLSANLAGQAPVEAFFLVVLRNGEAIDSVTAEFSNSSLTAWTMSDIPLLPGQNQIEIIGFSDRAGLVDSDEIEITSTVDWDPPALASVAPDTAAPEEFVTLTGSELHEGARVFFDGVESPTVVFNGPTSLDAEVSFVAVGPRPIRVRNIDGQESNALAFTALEPPPKFIRGDANMDGSVDLVDALKTLFFLYSGSVVTCRDALDTDDSGAVEQADAVSVLMFVFRHGVPPRAPYPVPGFDPTDADTLDCEAGL